MVDGSGVVHAVDIASDAGAVAVCKTEGGAGNCNNVAAPAVIGKYLHVGTTAGFYYVLERADGEGGEPA